MLLSGRDDKILRRVLLQHQPLSTDIVTRMAPVPLRIQIAQIQCLLKSDMNAGQRPGDLPGDKGLATQGRFMIEKDAVAGIKAVSLTIIDRDPVGIYLRRAVGGSRVKGGGLSLGYLLDFAKHLGGR